MPCRASDRSAAQAAQTGKNSTHRGHAKFDTGTFGEFSGNLRVDYVLPSNGFKVQDSGVFWPLPTQPGAQWLDASDHHLVWVDLANP